MKRCSLGLKLGLTLTLGLGACGNSSNNILTDAPSAIDAPSSMVDAPMRQPLATTFDCVHGWFFEVDDTGKVTETPYSELGVCLKWPRFIDPRTNLPFKSCSELPASTNAAADKAYDSGCRPLAAHPATIAKPWTHLFRPAFSMTLGDRATVAALSSPTVVSHGRTPTNNVGNNVGGVCNPLTQTGCAANQKCTWIIDTYNGNTPTGHLGCVPNGSVATGQACLVGTGGAMATGADNCQKGLVCNSDICKTVCDAAGGAPTCGTTASCATYASLFANQGEVAAAGVCDPNCDPLTQMVGTTAACGSPDPANPTKGCYGYWFDKGRSRFTCAKAGNPNAKQDFVLANARFINSCAPGFFSGLQMGTGSMQAICSAHCNPADVYQGHDQGKGGVLLPGKPAALATCGDRGAL